MEIDIVEKIKQRAKQNIKRIVLPESNDKRVLKAASVIASENVAKIILIGDRRAILDMGKKEGIPLEIDSISIIHPDEYDKKEEYVNKLYELRKHKGITLEDAQKLIQDPMYFGVMMVKENDADGLVSGAIHSTADTLRPALQIIKQKKDIHSASSFFLMQSPNHALGEEGLFVFADCGIIEFPTEEQLIDITKSSVDSFRLFVGKEPKVALLSYSTKGSGKSEAVTKVTNVYQRLKELNVDFEVDGELQVDAAIVPEVATLKAPNSSIKGKANILIFPDLQAGNIGYKLVQRFGNVVALGPITQGLNRPINDLSRGCNVEDIIGVIAITCVQAQE